MRNIIALDKWRFNLGDVDNVGYKGLDDAGWHTVRVPHDWALEYPFDINESSGTGYVRGGTGCYRVRFPCPAGERVRVVFEGVYNNAQVWVNSNYLGKRPYGYSTFSYDITEFLSDENVIAVRVPHEHTADSRWYTGSGITRPVYLVCTGTPSFEDFGVTVTTELLPDGGANVRVASRLDGEADIRLTLVDADGAAVASGEGADAVLTVKQPDLWSAETPYLYTLRADAVAGGVVTDSVSVRVGIRQARFDPDNGFYINGAPDKLRGVCVHHDAGALGAAVPPSVWRRRLLKLKAAGCNAIRTSHNPPDPALLDLCDELGFYVMDEAFDEWEMPKNKWWHGHNVQPPKRFGYYEDFPDWGERDVKTMVRRDRNHPSIVMWSIGNEIDYPNDPYVYGKFDTMTGNNDAGKSESERRFDPNRPNAARLPKIAHKLVRWVREEDSTRPVTAALAFPEMSTEVGLDRELDIVGYNYKEHLYESHRARRPDAVIFGSENGHGFEQWSAVADHDDCCAQFLWTGIDYLGEAHGWPVRASGAGILDLAGFEKDRYYHRLAMWSDKPCAALFTRLPRDAENPSRPPRWESYPFWSYRDGESVDIILYTNAQSAQFFINGEKVAEGEQKDRVIRASATYSAGTLTAVTSDGMTVEMKTPGKPAGVRLNAHECGGFYQTEVTLVDENGAIAAEDRVVRVNAPEDSFVRIENGDIADLTPYYTRSRRTRDGKLIVYSDAPVTAEIE
jgi:beta-galactosidase/beta-glucuronidase